MATRFRRLPSYLTRCCQCQRQTSRAYAQAHNGACKSCTEGVSGGNRSYDAIAREGGYEDTMGVSVEALESYRNGGDYGD